MGRYTTVQAYSDNNANMRTVSYEQAGGGGASSGGGGSSVKTEKVNNPYGSTAGAGSGEFHLYRHARSREMERLNQLDQNEKERQLDEEYSKKVQENKLSEERKTEQRRKKRLRQKESKLRKKNMKLSGITTTATTEIEPTINEIIKNEESQEKQMDENEDTQKRQRQKEVQLNAVSPKIEFANDGSFLEQMKKQLASSSPSAGSTKHKTTNDDVAEEHQSKKIKT